MPSVVGEGRRVVNNIERTASLFLVKNIFSLLLSLFSMIAVNGYPMEPSQVSLVAMFTIGIPAFFLITGTKQELDKRTVFNECFYQGCSGRYNRFLVVSALVVFCSMFNIDEESVSTACTVLISVVGFMILYRISKPMNWRHWLLIIAMIAGWIGCVIFLRPLFGITAMSVQCIMLLAVFALVADPVLRFFSLIVDKSFWRSKIDKVLGIVHRR